MKKIILCIISVICFTAVSQAQLLPNFKFGIKGGLNFSSLKSDGKWLNSETKTGYQAGIWARIGGAGFHVQPEAYFTGKNVKAEIIGENGEKGTLDFKSVDVPILLGTKFGLGPIGMRVQAGPVFSFAVEGESSLSKYADFSNYKKNAAGIIGGIGVDISKITVDLRYEHGLTNLNNNEARDQKINLWSLGVGIALF